MLKMRLQRRGKKNYATYRVVVADVRAPVKGRFVADVGSYNPHTDTFNVNGEKVADWLSKGVQFSSTVHNLLVTHKMLKADKVKSWRPKKRAGEESAEALRPIQPLDLARGKQVQGKQAQAKEKVEKKEEKDEKKEGTKKT